MTTTYSHFEYLPLQILKPQSDHQQRWSGDSDDDRQLIWSIQQFGILEPLVVEADTYRIINGHRRYGAAMTICLSSLPCNVYRLRDDRINIKDEYSLAA